jgi:hypothetical protein
VILPLTAATAVTANASTTTGSDSATALATLGLVIVTALLVAVTGWQVWLNRRALELSTRPLLADPRPVRLDDLKDHILFGNPGRQGYNVPRGELFHKHYDSSMFQFSVAFENIGNGPAAIVGARVNPIQVDEDGTMSSVMGSVNFAPKFVSVGSIVRVNVSTLTGMKGTERFDDQWWAMGGVEVEVEYLDSGGRRPLVSRATIKQYATQGPFVQEMSVFTKRKTLWKRKETLIPLVTGAASYTPVSGQIPEGFERQQAPEPKSDGDP